MEYSMDQIGDIRLVDLKIPGTHNSNTFSFKSMLNSIGKNQKWNISTQLNNGIRALDLRYGYDKKFIDKHGPIKGETFFDKFREVNDFLHFHKNEFIIIKIQAE